MFSLLSNTQRGILLFILMFVFSMLFFANNKIEANEVCAPGTSWAEVHKQIDTEYKERFPNGYPLSVSNPKQTEALKALFEAHGAPVLDNITQFHFGLSENGLAMIVFKADVNDCVSGQAQVPVDNFLEVFGKAL